MSRPGTWLWVLGALVGAAIAGADLLGSGPAGARFPDDAVAVVEGQPILRVDYERALAAVAADRRDGRLTSEDRRRVLERLIDEELLVGRALELGLASQDRKVRSDLSSAMIDLVTARAAASEPSEEELRAFYEARRDLFRPGPRVELAHAYFRAGEDDDAARRRAQAAAASGDLSSGDAPPIPLPAGPLDPPLLRRYLGPTAARGVSELSEGDTGGPWRAAHGYHVVRVRAVRSGAPAPFEAVAEEVRFEHQRQAAEEELRRFLSERRAGADIRLEPGR